MGGDPFTPPSSLTEEESSLGHDFPRVSMKSSFSSGDVEGLNFGEFRDVGNRVSSIFEARERQRCKIYAQVLRSYEDLQSGIERLEKAKERVLSYLPGSQVENVGGLYSRCYNVPETTSLLLIGPKGSGKSSLINNISRVLQHDPFQSERAQVSCNPSSVDGTFFLHEHKIPRGSGSFCLFDTRGLSEDPLENKKMIQSWMTDGVRHGELIKRNSDSIWLKTRLRFKARWRCSGARVRRVNFVIFVVNGLSVLETMNSDDDTKHRYSQSIATSFNNPYLSFKDDKPVLVVTHGDLLSLSDRVKIRVYLGELLGIHPTRQIFDIPETEDPATALAIVDMLNFSLERSDRNLPGKRDNDKVWSLSKNYIVITGCIYFPNREDDNATSAVGWAHIVLTWNAHRFSYLEILLMAKSDMQVLELTMVLFLAILLLIVAINL